MIVNALPEDVTWFSSEQQGAPQMLGQSNGDMLKVLDACLTDGWGLTNVLNVTSGNDYVTLTFNLAHGFIENQIILIKGASNPQLNGRHRIRSLNATSININVSGVVDEMSAITVETPALGWESLFGKTNPFKRAYRSTNAASAKRVLYLNMQHPASGSGYNATAPATRSSVSICQDMQVLGEQIGSFTDSINGFSTTPNGALFWYQKRDRVSGTAISNTITKWKLVGNKNFFLFIVGWHNSAAFNSTNYSDVFGFGELTPIVDSGQDRTFLMAITSNNNDGESINVGTLGGTMGNQYQSTYAYCFNSAGFSKNNIMPLLPTSANTMYLSGMNSAPYPNIYGDALFAMSCKVVDGDKNILGTIPSMLYIESNLNGGFDSKVIDGVMISKVQGLGATTKIEGNLGFYVGG